MEDELYYINNKLQGSCFFLSRPLLVVDIRDPRMSSTGRTLLAVISGRLPCLGFGFFFSTSRLYPHKRVSQWLIVFKLEVIRPSFNHVCVLSILSTCHLVNLSSRQLVNLSSCQLVSPSACKLAHLGAFLHYVNKQFIHLEI